jgi:hypothetical protein
MEKYIELIVAIVAVLMSLFSLWHQRNHDRLTYKPLPVIIKYNYNDRVLIRLWNKGAGPLFIRSLTIEDKDSLIALMPAEARKLTFVEFIDNLPDRVITPGDNLNLLEFKVREDDERYSPEKYKEVLNTIKRTLNSKTIQLVYTNIYKDIMTMESKPLDFGNLIDESKTVEEIERELRERNSKKGKTETT